MEVAIKIIRKTRIQPLSNQKQGAKPKEEWLEILGAGMIHPEVLKNMNVNPLKYQGFAFGLGVDRLAMILAQYFDIRLNYQGDLRFLKQFASQRHFNNSSISKKNPSNY